MTTRELGVEAPAWQTKMHEHTLDEITSSHGRFCVKKLSMDNIMAPGAQDAIVADAVATMLDLAPVIAAAAHAPAQQFQQELRKLQSNDHAGAGRRGTSMTRRSLAPHLLPLPFLPSPLLPLPFLPSPFCPLPSCASMSMSRPAISCETPSSSVLRSALGN